MVTSTDRVESVVAFYASTVGERSFGKSVLKWLVFASQRGQPEQKAGGGGRLCSHAWLRRDNNGVPFPQPLSSEEFKVPHPY